jgi:hypothetical protein
MARIMNWFDAVYNHVIATWAEQSLFAIVAFYYATNGHFKKGIIISWTLSIFMDVHKTQTRLT